MSETNNLVLVVIIVMLIVFFIELSDGKIWATNNTQEPGDSEEYSVPVKPFLKSGYPARRYKRKKKLKIFKDDISEVDPQIPLEAMPGCVEESKSIKEFNEQFFNFRDNIYENTSIRLDPVTKINHLRVNEHLYNTDKLRGQRIADISDYATRY